MDCREERKDKNLNARREFCYEIKLLKEPSVSLLLIPWFVPIDKTRLDIGWELHERLRENPNDTFVLVAKKRKEIHGVLIAYARKNDVFVWQAKARNDLSCTKIMFDVLIKWSLEKGYNRMAIETTRNPRVFKRRWGFEVADVYTSNGSIFYKMIKHIK